MKQKIIFILFWVCILLSGCEHHHLYSTVTVPATCLSGGYTQRVCSCGDTIITNETPIGEHKYGEWVITVEPTETTLGLKQKECIYCGDSISEELDVLEHIHKYIETIIAPTCEQQGYLEHVCEGCGDTYRDSYSEALNHMWVEADCENPKYCINCDQIIGQELGHDYSDWEITLEPTYNKEGLKTRVCKRCNHIEDQEIPRLVEILEFDVIFDLNGGIFDYGYQNLEELSNDFIKDYNLYGNTNASITQFHSDSTNSIKTAFSNIAMLDKWQWLFEYMYLDLINYNKSINALNVSYVSDAIDLLELMKDGDTSVIKDSSKGPNFRTLIRSYLHGVMNNSKGCPEANKTFAQYVPDFSNVDLHYPLLGSQYVLNQNVKSNEPLPNAVRVNYIFEGWKGEDGLIKQYPTTNEKLLAVWKEGTPVEKIEITNKVETLELYNTLQLSWTITPNNAVNKNVEFVSSNPEIATIDNNGLITAKKQGTVTIKILSKALSAESDEFTLKVVTPGYFDFSYETNSYVLVGDSIKLNAVYYNSIGQTEQLIWTTLNDDLVEVNSIGEVNALSVGTAIVRVMLADNNNIYQDFIIAVIDEEIYNALAVVLEAHESNVYVEYNLGIGAGTPVYYTDIIGSVSKLLFNDTLTIYTTYNKATNAKYGDALESRVIESVEFITVHYTGGMTKGSTAEATAKYFAMPLSQVATSIHYCTGNDGVFKGIDEQYKAAHAGDDGSTATVEKFEWLDTNIDVLPGDPKFPVVTITKNSTFAINGRDTNIKIPVKTQRGNEGYVTDNKWLNEMGLAVNIKDGKYQLGTSWWCYTQVWEGRICSNGGNRNSIGIESAVNEGSDLWYTWQKTAQLVADLMYRYNLDITRVKGHHFFSAKNCPQPMLENELRLWWEFIELCEAEFDKLTKLDDNNLTFTSKSELVDNHGRIKQQNLTSEMVSYQVELKVNDKTYSIELGSIIEGIYTK